MLVDISKCTRGQVLAALYNNSRPLGMGVFQAKPGDMTVEDADAILDEAGLWPDYIHGRPIKADLRVEGVLDPRLYDRDNGGDGAALRVLLEAGLAVAEAEAQSAS